MGQKTWCCWDDVPYSTVPYRYGSATTTIVIKFTYLKVLKGTIHMVRLRYPYHYGTVLSDSESNLLKRDIAIT